MSTTNKELSLNEFLGTISMSERDKWVVRKIFNKDVEKRSRKKWLSVFKSKCKGITYKTIE